MNNTDQPDLNSRTLAGVSYHCVHQARKRIPYFKSLCDLKIKAKLEQAVHCASRLGLIYDNPKKQGQYLAYAHFHGRDLWLVLGPNKTKKDGEWVVVTVLVHNDYFEEMLSHANKQLGTHVGAAA